MALRSHYQLQASHWSPLPFQVGALLVRCLLLVPLMTRPPNLDLKTARSHSEVYKPVVLLVFIKLFLVLVKYLETFLRLYFFLWRENSAKLPQLRYPTSFTHSPTPKNKSRARHGTRFNNTG